MAAGLTIPASSYPDFARIFDEVVSRVVREEDLLHFILSDGELLPEDFNLEVASLIRDAGPWGQAFPEPIFDGTFAVAEQRIVGDKHLKLRLQLAGQLIDAIAFFVDTAIWPNHRCETIHAAYRLEVNEYKGRRNLQLVIDYLEPV